MPSDEAIYVTSIAAALMATLITYMAWSCRSKKGLLRTFGRELAKPVTTEKIQDLERALGGLLPVTLKEVYRTGRLMSISLPAIFKVDKAEFAIVQFMQVDRDLNKVLTDLTQTGENAFVFAADDFGNYYFVRANDESLYFWDHELGIELIFESVANLWRLLNFQEHETGHPLGRED